MTNQNPEFEFTLCPLCGSANSGFHISTPDRFALKQNKLYNLVCCSDCSHVYLNPRPVEQSSGIFYKNADYSPHMSTDKRLKFQDRLYNFLRKYNNRFKRRLIENIKPERGKILDIGCGTGEFLQAMHGAGWQAYGVERDTDAAALANQKTGIKITTGILDNLAATDSNFDVITLWHVLEHIYQPELQIEKIKNLLAPDGMLIIAVPNCASLDAKFYKTNWIAWDTPRHVNHFHTQSLQRFMSHHEFKLLKKSSLSLDALFNALMSEQLINKRAGGGIAMIILRMMRASIIGFCSMVAGWFSPFLEQSRSASLLTIWQKRR